MNIIQTPIQDLLVIEPKVFGDTRGFFFESFNARAFSDLTGFRAEFVQDNHSKSVRDVVRGLHYQIKQPQGKLVRVIAGEVFDVAVDLRRSSPNFGQWYGLYLSQHDKRMLWIPPGFAHGFMVVSETAEFLYKTTDYWAPEYERTIRWDDPDLAVQWPIQLLSNGGKPLLSDKDLAGQYLRDTEVFE